MNFIVESTIFVTEELDQCRFQLAVKPTGSFQQIVNGRIVDDRLELTFLDYAPTDRSVETLKFIHQHEREIIKKLKTSGYGAMLSYPHHTEKAPKCLEEERGWCELNLTDSTVSEELKRVLGDRS